MNTPPTTQHTTAGNMPPPLNLRGIGDSERYDLDDVMTDLSSMFEDESTVGGGFVHDWKINHSPIWEEWRARRRAQRYDA